MVSSLRIRYTDGRGVLRRLLQAATSQGFTIDELSTDTSGRRSPEAQEGRPLVEVTLQVHGKQSVNNLAALLSDIDDVDAVMVDDANAVDE